MSQSRAAYQREWRHRQRQLGRCSDCTLSAVRGGRCETHANASVERTRRSRGRPPADISGAAMAARIARTTLIREAVAQADGSVSRAARALGLSRETVYLHLAKLSLGEPITRRKS